MKVDEGKSLNGNKLWTFTVDRQDLEKLLMALSAYVGEYDFGANNTEEQRKELKAMSEMHNKIVEQLGLEDEMKI